MVSDAVEILFALEREQWSGVFVQCIMIMKAWKWSLLYLLQQVGMEQELTGVERTGKRSQQERICETTPRQSACIGLTRPNTGEYLTFFTGSVVNAWRWGRDGVIFRVSKILLTRPLTKNITLNYF